MFRLLFMFAGLSGLASVVAGAFGAHALKGLLDPKMFSVFETAVQYQMSHSLVLLLTCLLIQQWKYTRPLRYASYAFCLGIVCFSGSLYVLALTNMTWPGPVTPLGGIFLISGWILLCIGIWQNALLQRHDSSEQK